MASVSDDIPLSVGIDLGGTNIKAALVDRQGRILARDLRPTGSQEGAKAVVRHMVDGVEAVAAQGGVPVKALAGVGVGVPAVISAQGVALLAPNLHWRDFPVRAALETCLPVRVSVDNDANVAALAEARAGSGAGCASLFFITLGTGIGGGIVLDGRVHHGASFDPGEIGHLCMRPDGPRCGCGQRGCLEALASGTAMVRDARAAIASGRPSAILRIAEAPERITPEVICRAAREGDGLACDIFKAAAEYLGIAIANVIHLLSPEVIAVGGGIAEAGPLLLDPIVETARRRALPGTMEHTRVVKAQLRNDAGAIGAGLLAF